MDRIQVKEMEARLRELAEYYGVKPPSAPALKIWYDVLGASYWPDVASAFTDWPKRSGSMPTADRIFKIANERVSERVEEESRRHRAEAGSFRLENLKPNSDVAYRELAKIKAILASPRPHPKAWAGKLVARHLAGDYVQQDMLTAAVKIAREQGELPADWVEPDDKMAEWAAGCIGRHNRGEPIDEDVLVAARDYLKRKGLPYERQPGEEG